MNAARPAWYALRPGGWRDYVTLLHPPWTLWHLSYVVLGASLAPELRPSRLAWTLLAFALAMGVGAHALDELRGRPLRTRIRGGVLVGLAVASVGGAAAIGVGAALAWNGWLLAFVAAGVFLVAAYNLELFGGRFHTPLVFALAWGAFPVLTAYFACAERLSDEALAAAAFGGVLALAQQILSRQVRDVRRRVARVSGAIELVDGTTSPLTAGMLLDAPERALKALAASTVLLSLALLLRHVS